MTTDLQLVDTQQASHQPPTLETIRRRAREAAEAGDGHAAIRLLHAALVREPDHAPTLTNLGSLLLRAHAYDGALPLLLRAAELAPEKALVWENLGMVYGRLGRLEEALPCFEKAAALDPSEPLYRGNLGMTCLLMGDYKRGWPLCQEHPHLNSERPTSDKPRWMGEAGAEGETLLVACDGGYGDNIMFSRYLSYVRERWRGRIVFACYPNLVNLYKQSPCVTEIVAHDPESETFPADFDCYVFLSQLPHIFGHGSPEEVEAHVPYLLADAEKVANWLSAWEETGFTGPRVGFCWSGNPLYGLDQERGVPIAKWATLLNAHPEVHWISLQVDKRAQVLSRVLQPLCHYAEIGDVSESVKDFSDTAAVIATLDLVITVDTAVGHLAAALGVPTWILLPKCNDWRWGREREDSPWYPGVVRLFRQANLFRWEETMKRVALALERVGFSRSMAAEDAAEAEEGGTSQELGLPPSQARLTREQFDIEADFVLNLSASHRHILSALVRWLKPETVVEVGSHLGGTSIHLARALQENGCGRLVCIDNFTLLDVKESDLRSNLNACGVSEVVEIINGFSEQVQWPAKVDFAYIDGCHSYEACKFDAEKARVRGASLICLHDTTSWWGPRQFLEEVRGSLAWEGWDILEVPFDNGLGILYKRGFKPPVGYTQEEYPEGV